MVNHMHFRWFLPSARDFMRSSLFIETNLNGEFMIFYVYRMQSIIKFIYTNKAHAIRCDISFSLFFSLCLSYSCWYLILFFFLIVALLLTPTMMVTVDRRMQQSASTLLFSSCVCVCVCCTHISNTHFVPYRIASNRLITADSIIINAR